MNRDDIIRMAREARLWLFYDSEGHCDGITDVELITAEKDRDDDRLAEILMPFANLVAAAERERIKWDTIHSCHPECDKPVCVAIRKAVLEEREACAKVAEEWQLGIDDPKYQTDCAFAIRERGAP